MHDSNRKICNEHERNRKIYNEYRKIYESQRNFCNKHGFVRPRKLRPKCRPKCPKMSPKNAPKNDSTNAPKIPVKIPLKCSKNAPKMPQNCHQNAPKIPPKSPKNLKKKLPKLPNFRQNRPKTRGSIVKNGQKKFRQLCPKPKIARPWRASLGGPLRNFFFKIPRLNIFQPKLREIAMGECSLREHFPFSGARSWTIFRKLDKRFSEKKTKQNASFSREQASIFVDFQTFSWIPNCSRVWGRRGHGLGRARGARPPSVGQARDRGESPASARRSLAGGGLVPQTRRTVRKPKKKFENRRKCRACDRRETSVLRVFFEENRVQFSKNCPASAV